MEIRIKFGDTLGALAKRFGTSVGNLAKANGIRDINRIFAGKTLKVERDTRSLKHAQGRMNAYRAAEAPQQVNESFFDKVKGATGTAMRFVKEAMRFIGQPYRWGGGHGAWMKGPAPVDCSGLVQQASNLAGAGRSGTAATFQRMGKAVDMRSLRPGDLVFRGSPAHHVGIYVGGGKVLHAPTTGKRVSFVGADYFESARRLF
ncbi:D-gamma-glutamyl-meso-diaminopimelic acid endopeptidase CwlS precursor [compost metagenome]